MPSTSSKQRRFMAAAAHNSDFARKAGIKQSVAREFNQADQDKKEDKKKALLFADVIKQEPAMTDVHLPTALGNEGGPGKRKKKPRAFVGSKPPGNADPDISLAKLFDDVMAGDISTFPRKLGRHDGSTARIPFKYQGNALASLRPDQMPRFLGALTDPDGLEMRDMKFNELTAIQNRVDPNKVQAMARSPQFKRPAVVIRTGGLNVIGDGHHRLAAEWLRGKDSAMVRFADVARFSNVLKTDLLQGGHQPEVGTIEVTKIDPDQRLVFGWASVIEKDGKLVIDKQGDAIPPHELENAVYEFVLGSRENDDMHRRPKTGRLVESIVFTKQKQEALGIDLGRVGWFAGFKIDDDELWAAHKRGDRPEFSLSGAAVPLLFDESDLAKGDKSAASGASASVHSSAPPHVSVSPTINLPTINIPELKLPEITINAMNKATRKHVTTKRDAQGNLIADVVEVEDVA